MQTPWRPAEQGPRSATLTLSAPTWLRARFTHGGVEHAPGPDTLNLSGPGRPPERAVTGDLPHAACPVLLSKHQLTPGHTAVAWLAVAWWRDQALRPWLNHAAIS